MSQSSFTPRQIALGVLSLLLVFFVGLVGGVSGFVLLSNSHSAPIQRLRDKLGLGEDQIGVAVPVRQKVTLEESSALIDAVKKVSPAVVTVTGSQNIADFFTGTSSTQKVLSGSGFILTSDGLIITNKHVVSTANTQYKVLLSDGRTFDAKVQSLDPLNDLAVLKIDARDLPTVELGSSEQLQIGQSVFAVGNPFGEYSNTVTQGIVSGLQRHVTAEQGEDLSDLIQTDAAINQGNSGGPLLNIAGQVVGINTAIASESGGSDGVGFAIPIDSIRSAIDSVIRTGTIQRPVLGVRYQMVTKTLQQLGNLPVDYGAQIVSDKANNLPAVQSGYPAEKAGLREVDIILEVNGQRVDENNSLARRMQKFSVGDEITLTVQRGDQKLSISVKLDKAASN